MEEKEKNTKANVKSSGGKKEQKKSSSNAKKRTTSTTKKSVPSKKAGETKKQSTVRKKATTTKKQAALNQTQKNKSLNGKTEKKQKNNPKKETKPTKEKYVISETIPQEMEEIHAEINGEKKITSFEKYEIPVTNYFIAIIAIVWTFVIAFLGFHLYKTHQESLYKEGYFNHTGIIQKTTFENIHDIMENSGEKELFILFNYHSEKEHYELEEDLEQIIEDYHLKHNFYYIDIMNYKEVANCDLSCAVNRELGSEIKTFPAIFYIKEKKVIDVAKRDDKKVLEASDFVKLLDMYEFKK